MDGLAGLDALRVLVLGDHFGYAGGVVHGITSYYLTVLPWIRRAGIDVRCLFLRQPHPSAEALRGSAIPVEFLSAGKWNPFVLREVMKVARAMDANVLHVVGMKAALVGRLVARRMRAALILHSHDLNMPPWPVRAMHPLLRVENEWGIAVSMAAGRFMKRAYGIAPDRLVVLPNGIDLTGIRSVDPSRRPEGLPRQARLIAWVGRFHAIKAPERMIRIMARVAPLVPDAALVMVGDGPEIESCRRLVERLNLKDHVFLLGQRSDVGSILHHVQLLGITSRQEGFSLVAAEAAAAAVPTVAYRVGGLSEVIIDGRTGVLVRDDDIDAFVAAVVKLLGDQQERGRLGASAAAHSEEFSVARHVDSLMNHYRRAAALAGGAH